MKHIFLSGLIILGLLGCKPEYINENPVNGNDLIRLNQLGYFPGSTKRFVVTGLETDSFDIINREGLVVYKGLIEPTGFWEKSGEKVWMGDFSGLTDAGIFHISVKGLGNSWPFRIDKSLYNEVAKASLKSFYLQRMSMDLDEVFAGIYQRKAGHPDTVCLYHPSSGKSEGFKPSAGGWYDAGDYGKYIVNAGVTVGAMLNLAEIKTNVFGDKAINIPESGNGLDDYLDEIKYELDWMLTMQDQDGGVFHKLTTKNFEGFVMPAEAINQRYIIGKSTAASLDFSAVMAMAGRLYKLYDADFAAHCLQASENAWLWAKANPEEFYAGNPEDIQTGAYNDVKLAEEFFWAASELYTSTGDDIYLNEIQSKLGKITFRVEESWRNYVDNLGYYSLVTDSSPLSPEGKEVVLAGIVSLADSLAEVVEAHPYRIPLHHFKWGSNSDILNLATVFTVAYHYTKDSKYQNYALETMDYIFGKNAVGYSFVTGFGNKTPLHIHHRPSEADDVFEPFPGLVVGGPNMDRQDKWSLSEAGLTYLFDEPARSYVDKTQSFASNEICLNWNGPLTFMLGYFMVQED